MQQKLTSSQFFVKVEHLPKLRNSICSNYYTFTVQNTVLLFYDTKWLLNIISSFYYHEKLLRLVFKHVIETDDAAAVYVHCFSQIFHSFTQPELWEK